MSAKCFSDTELRSPKLDPQSLHGKSSWYHYYAGYSPTFVKDVLNYLDLPPNATVMDPWNGSGTTTQVAKDMGFSAIGYDINPVMVIVAKSKMLESENNAQPSDYINIITKNSDKYSATHFLDVEPLEIWLTQESACTFRNIERAIQKQFMSNDYRVLYAEKSLAKMSNLAAFFYTALFRVLRRFLESFHTTNPTWIKTPTTKDDRIRVSANQIYFSFEKQVKDMEKDLEKPSRKDSKPIFEIDHATSSAIPLQNRSVNAVVSSPPYCTRIDYAIATKPELALLGCSMGDDLKMLRNNMIGTPTVNKIIPEMKPEWGDTCIHFLNAVENHQSKASKSYYLKYYLQYFDSVYRSLLEIDRTLVTSGRCVLVVQDSYYKDIHNKLPRIYTEMVRSIGWNQINKIDFKVKHTMAGCNQKIKKYRRSPKAVESVLMYKN